jgi:SIR2-like domain
VHVTVAAPAMRGNDPGRGMAPRRIVYLMGAGATQGAVQFGGSTASLVMRGLIERLLESTSDAYEEAFSDHVGLKRLVNDVISDDTDFEHLLTFLEDTPSRHYQEFAQLLETVFLTVLLEALDDVRDELGEDHSALYAVLLDMHEVADSGERLAGFLTLNYDDFLEHAIERRLGRTIDYGVQVTNQDGKDEREPIPVLKLHGSFSWRHTWPVEIAEEIDAGLWIPPGIRKAKAEYPFNEIWGAARELLDCDVLRIIGCNLGPNDWDLVSLLFTTMHGHESGRPYEIEVIGRPNGAARISESFPYLNVRPLLELPKIGALFIAELLGSEPKDFSDLDEAEQERAIGAAESKITNPFQHWLRLKGELMHQDLPSLDTDLGLFKRFIEDPLRS